MTENETLPPNLDRRPNGRCRAYWLAYDHAPSRSSPFEWAIKNFDKFLNKAKELDEKDGMLPCCRPYSKERKLKPIRKRNYVKKVE